MSHTSSAVSSTDAVTPTDSIQTTELNEPSTDVIVTTKLVTTEVTSSLTSTSNITPTVDSMKSTTNGESIASTENPLDHSTSLPHTTIDEQTTVEMLTTVVPIDTTTTVEQTTTETITTTTENHFERTTSEIDTTTVAVTETSYVQTTTSVVPTESKDITTTEVDKTTTEEDIFVTTEISGTSKADVETTTTEAQMPTTTENKDVSTGHISNTPVPTTEIMETTEQQHITATFSLELTDIIKTYPTEQSPITTISHTNAMADDALTTDSNKPVTTERSQKTTTKSPNVSVTLIITASVRVTSVAEVPAQFSSKFLDPNDPTYKLYESSICAAVIESLNKELYKGKTIECEVVQFRNGSIIADTKLMFINETKQSVDQVKVQEELDKLLKTNNQSVIISDVTVTDYNECTKDEDNDCSDHALCINLEGGYTCSCNAGFSDNSVNTLTFPGRQCGQKCTSDHCNYNGYCFENQDGAPTCSCNQKFGGVQCQYSENDDWEDLVIVIVVIIVVLFLPLLIFGVVVCIKKRNKRQLEKMDKYRAGDEYSWSDSDSVPQYRRGTDVAGALRGQRPQDSRLAASRGLGMTNYFVVRNVTVPGRADYPMISRHQNDGYSREHMRSQAQQYRLARDLYDDTRNAQINTLFWMPNRTGLRPDRSSHSSSFTTDHRHSDSDHNRYYYENIY